MRMRARLTSSSASPAGYDDRAGAAGSNSAAKFRAVHGDMVAEDIEQRRVPLAVHAMNLAVHSDVEWHGRLIYDAKPAGMEGLQRRELQVE